jgi:hypothetical protein
MSLFYSIVINLHDFGGIKTPSEDCMGCFKNIKRYIDPISIKLE